YPFGRGPQMQVLKRKLDHQFKPLSHLSLNVSPALDQVIIRALHPNPEVRPHSAEEFLAALSGDQSGLPVVQPNPPPLQELSGPERRAFVRYAVQLTTRFESIASGQGDSWEGIVVDISSGGLCLQIGRRFESNRLLQVYLPAEQPDL